jgi:hypothetical protein
MRESKKIERLFQEKLKDFEAVPPNNAWENIASNLKKPLENKRKLPSFFYFANIAAVLFLLIFFGWNFNQNSSVFPDFKTSKKNGNSFEKEKLDKNTTIENSSRENALVNQKEKENSLPSDDDKKLNDNNNSTTNVSVTNRKNYNQKRDDINRIVFDDDFKKESLNPKKKKKSKKSELPNFNVVVNNNTVTIKSTTDKGSLNYLSSEKEKSLFFSNEVDLNASNKNTDTNSFENNKFVFSDITGFNLIDSIPLTINQKTENPLEKILMDKDKKEIAYEEEVRNKWALGTNITPVYFNSLGNGSPIDPVFINSSKEYKNTTSLGINASYEIAKKFSLKSGINVLNMSYTTNDVVYQSSIKLVNSNPSNINRNQFGITLAFTSKNNMADTFTDIDNYVSKNVGSLRQDIGYLEIPLELGYKLVDRKFKIEIIGGVSTLFLNNNSISLIKDDLELEIGKANNLNKIHFSSNFGLGFNYRFWKAFSANFQPMFKYQINTFNQNDGNFKPYFIGLNSGLSYHF